MRRLTALIADDEKIMCAALRSQLENFPYIDVVGECHDGQAALDSVKLLNPDIVFLDIRMPGLTGLEVAAEIDKHDNPAEIVFVTAYDEYALKGYEVGATDYILKPFDSDNIVRVLRKILRRRLSPKSSLVQPQVPPLASDTRPSKFCLYTDERMEIVDAKNIKCFLAEHGTVYALTVDDARCSVKQSLQEIEQMVDRKHFFRCHRNYIVNVDFVRTVSPWFNRGLLLTLSGAKVTEIPVSRAHTKQLEQYINF